MELNLENQGQSPIGSMIQNIVFSDNLLQKMRASVVVVNALDEKAKRNTRADLYKRYLNRLFSDKPLIRKIKYISLLRSNIETAIEYTGYDYISEPDFQYDTKLEKVMDDIEDKLTEFLGAVLRELQKGMEIEL